MAFGVTVCILAVAISVVVGAPTPTDTYTHDAFLDELGKYHLYWKFDDATITFEVVVETLGYVGFGISPNGGMVGSDVVIGWVKDGKAYLTDRFAEEKIEPVIDESQDYELIGGMETETHTVLTFSRRIDTCDDMDTKITAGTLRLIYAYHADDPEGQTGLPYHGEHRGVRSVHLLGVAPELPEMPTGEDLFTFEFLNPNFSVPHHKHTTYWCQAFKMPQLDRKHHMIKYEPVIQEGHEALVHHIIVYQCRHAVDDDMDGVGHECYSPNMPGNLTWCTTTIIAWAIGGGGFYLPEEAGFSLGDVDNGDPDFVLMETHYDNPQYSDTFYDSSGIRIYYTPILRDNDAAVLMTGNSVSHWHAIPPGSSAVTTSGYCTYECLNDALGDAQITVFGSLLHAHLAGVGIRARHIRDGVELPVIAEDTTYDFNFQEMRHLKEPITVKSGDELIIECTYDTQSRSSMLYGGLSTQKEMCLAFMYYYPKNRLAECSSDFVFDIALNILVGVTSIDYTVFPPVVSEPAEYAGRSVFDIFEGLEWSQDQVEMLEVAYQYGYSSVCSKGGGEYYPTNGHFSFTRNVTELPDEESVCKTVSAAARNKRQGTAITLTVLSILGTVNLF